MKKTTQDLLKQMHASRDYQSYLDENRSEITGAPMRIDRAISARLAESGRKKATVIARSGVEPHYAYQIFSGTKVPTRDKVLMLCIGMELSAEETQHLLKVTGYPQLYAKTERVNAILFGLTHHLSVIDINAMLYELGQALLT